NTGAAAGGTHHATPSLETFELVIGLATSRVFCRSAPGSVQPAATAGSGELLAVPGGPPAARPDKQLAVPGWLREQPPAARPAATTRHAPATPARWGALIPPRASPARSAAAALCTQRTPPRLARACRRPAVRQAARQPRFLAGP